MDRNDPGICLSFSASETLRKYTKLEMLVQQKIVCRDSGTSALYIAVHYTFVFSVAIFNTSGAVYFLNQCCLVSKESETLSETRIKLSSGTEYQRELHYLRG